MAKAPKTFKKQKKVILRYLYEAYKSISKPVSYPTNAMPIGKIAERYNTEFNTELNPVELEQIINSLYEEKLIIELDLYHNNTSYLITDAGIHKIENNKYIEWVLNPDNFWKVIGFVLGTLLIPLLFKYLFQEKQEKQEPKNKVDTLIVYKTIPDTTKQSIQKRDTVKVKKNKTNTVKTKEKAKVIFGTSYSEEYLKEHPELRNK